MAVLHLKNFGKVIPLFLVTARERVCDRAQAGDEGGRTENGSVFAPAQDPALDFFQAAKGQGELEAAVRKAFHFLRGVPLALVHKPCGKGIETHAHPVPALAAEDGEAVAEEIRNGEIDGALKFYAGVARFAHARQGEGPELAAREVVAEDIPLVFDAAEVVGLNAPGFVLGAAEFFIIEGEFAVLENCAADDFEEFEVGDAGAQAAKGDGRVHVGPLKTDLPSKALGDFLKGGTQGFLKGSAAILFESFLRHEEGDDFTFGDFHAGQAADRFGVVEAEMRLIPLDWILQLVAHVIDIALHGLAGDFEFLGQFPAIRKCAGAEFPMQSRHANEWRSGTNDCRTFTAGVDRNRRTLHLRRGKNHTAR